MNAESSVTHKKYSQTLMSSNVECWQRTSTLHPDPTRQEMTGICIKNYTKYTYSKARAGF